MGTLFKGSGTWATLDTGQSRPRDAETLQDLGEHRGWAVFVEDGVIREGGPPADLERRYAGAEVVDFGDRLVTPGFVDPHTHPVFAATREDEFELRVMGRSYEEIAKAGGGIRNSARRLRGIATQELAADLRQRADRFLLLGTTTIEAKSGYGLSTDAELRSLEAIQQVSSDHALEMVPTFLGAHEIPDEYQGNREEYIRILCEEMIPAVAARKLAEACDVFCEEHVFTVAESRRILACARDFGLQLKLHADEIKPTGGAELAAEMGALSADHLVAVTPDGMDRMKDAGVIPILLPGTSFFLGLPADAPGEEMLRRGLCPALATDFNPGSCPTRSMPLIMTLACLKYRMTPAQALGAATWNAAWSIGRGATLGSLAPGYQADLAVFDLPSVQALPYLFGENFVHTVVKKGRVVVREGRLTG
jgi:imidazolonepropionase